MELLDIRTIAVIFFINCLVATLFMAALWQQSRRQFHGISLWLTSFVLLTAAFALISLRNVIPDIASILIANCCVVAAAFILYLGLEHFVACPSSQRHNYIVLAIFVCLFTYFTFFQSNVAIRIILLNLTLLLLFLQSGWLMLHRVGTQLKPLNRATGIVCLLYAVVSCYRIILVIFTSTPGDFLDMDLWDATGLIISQILTIVLALVLLLMVNHRTLRNFFDQEEILIRSKVELEISNRDLTERMLAEEELKLNKEKYRNLFENAGEAIYVAQGGKLIFLNPQTSRMTGYPAKDLMERQFTEFIHVDDRDLVIDRHMRRLKGEILPEQYEFRIVHKSGSVIWAELNTVLITWEGKPATLNFLKDVTERRLVENALQESELRYRNIFENALVGIFQKIPGGRYISANPTFARMYGFDTPDDLMSRIVNVKNEFYSSPQDYKLIKQQLDSAMIIKDFEAEGKRRDGTKIWLSICIRAVRDDRGKILYYEGTTVDISERKRAQAASRENEEKYRTVLDAIEEAYFELDLAGNMTFCNDYLCSSLGYSQEEILGTNYHIWVAEEDHEKAYKSFHQAYLTGSFKNVAFIMLRKDGTRTYTECSTTSKRDSEGEVVGFRGVGHDITERKQVEQELENSRQVLRDLSARLINLREEERTLLAREIHDELGQALTALKMDLSWLSKKLPEGLHGEKTASMLNLVDTTAKMVKRISTELRPGLLDDLGLVAAMEWQAGEFQDRTGIKTELRFEPDDIVVNNEQATALFRIFQEALTNVARHAAATRINAYLHEKDGALELCVRDNGKGIEQTMINSPKSFGLIGVRERCYHLGGAVDIVGKKGKGTIITVNLPFRETKQ